MNSEIIIYNEPGCRLANMPIRPNFAFEMQRLNTRQICLLVNQQQASPDESAMPLCEIYASAQKMQLILQSRHILQSVTPNQKVGGRSEVDVRTVGTF
jgi:hypothetical protein